MKLRNKKTGEVFDALIREKGGGDKYSIIVCDIKAYKQSKSTLDATHFILDEYDSLSELNEEWEDYEPVEPLIKDEKIRKVFREWAEFFSAERFRVTHLSSSTVLRSNDLTAMPSIDLPDHIGKDSEIYTITELCGEEEK